MDQDGGIEEGLKFPNMVLDFPILQKILDTDSYKDPQHLKIQYFQTKKFKLKNIRNFIKMFYNLLIDNYIFF